MLSPVVRCFHAPAEAPTRAAARNGLCRQIRRILCRQIRRIRHGREKTGPGALNINIFRKVSRLDQRVSGLDQKFQNLDATVNRVAKELAQTQTDVREIKATMSTKDDVNRILGAIDSFVGKAQNYDRAATLHGHSLTELQTQVKDHEGRIKNLESGRS